MEAKRIMSRKEYAEKFHKFDRIFPIELGGRYQDYLNAVEVPDPNDAYEEDGYYDEDGYCGERGDSIIDEADNIIKGDRLKYYGHPLDNHKNTADFWNAWLGRKYGATFSLTADDVAIMMVLLKISREANQSKRDNWVDMIGYTANLEQMDNERYARAQKVNIDTEEVDRIIQSETIMMEIVDEEDPFDASVLPDLDLPDAKTPLHFAEERQFSQQEMINVILWKDRNGHSWDKQWEAGEMIEYDKADPVPAAIHAPNNLLEPIYKQISSDLDGGWTPEEIEHMLKLDEEATEDISAVKSKVKGFAKEPDIRGWQCLGCGEMHYGEEKPLSCGCEHDEES